MASEDDVSIGDAKNRLRSASQLAFFVTIQVEMVVVVVAVGRGEREESIRWAT